MVATCQDLLHRLESYKAKEICWKSNPWTLPGLAAGMSYGLYGPTKQAWQQPTNLCRCSYSVTLCSTAPSQPQSWGQAASSPGRETSLPPNPAGWPYVSKRCRFSNSWILNYCFHVPGGDANFYRENEILFVFRWHLWNFSSRYLQTTGLE